MNVPLARRAGLVLAAACTLIFPLPLRAQEEDTPKVVHDGRQVSLEYTLKLDNGSTVDSNVGRDPLVYTQGEKQILPALENKLAGLAAGDTKHVTLGPEDAYGPIDKEAFVTVDTEQVPAEARKVGERLSVQAQNGQTLQCRVHEVGPEQVVLDFNHPLAGETLHFDVKVLDVQ